MMNYYLGLDIGTNSVGWAVTDEQYRLCRFKKKDMWGIRLFEDAQTAEERRLNRTARRRLDRKKQRIQLLQELFAEEMAKIDSTFFIRLNESRLYREDKSTDFKHVLFAGNDYTDIDFHNDYPTFYHLRNALMEDTAPHDIRLLYLALHHIIKNRGHFLVSGDLSNVTDFSLALNQLKDEYHNYFDEELDITDEAAFENTLKAKDKSKTDKQSRLKSFINLDTEDLDKTSQKASQKKVAALCKLMVGLKGNLIDVFGEDVDIEEEFSTIEFSKDNYEEETLPELEKQIPEEMGLINAVQALYNWQVLDEVMRGEKYFSNAQVKSYEKHQEQLSYSPEHQPNLRSILKKYLAPQDYKTFFNDRSEKGKNYSHYIGHIKINGKNKSVNRCSKEDFYKDLKKLLGKIKENGIDDKDENIVEFLITETVNQTLLPLQRSKDNSIVPKQAHEAELNEILRQCEYHFPFLKAIDEKGLSVSDKIKSIFNFKVPYYVGPLGKKKHNDNDNHWMVRKEEGRITPWNFKEKVDEEKSNAAFIARMTNKCTYLIGEDVLPKNALSYSRYMVLNELNNLKIRGKAISVKQKQNIYLDLFCGQKKVTGKQLLKYLQKDDSELDQSMLSGFDQDFKTSLSSLLAIQQVFGSPLTDKQIKMSEDIIRWATIYGNDGKMLVSVVKNHYGDVINAEQLRNVKKLRFSGWGNFSEKFLTGISGKNLETGEQYDSILECMWETNDNLMQVLSEVYDFREQIDKINADNTGEIKEFSYDTLVKDLVTSPANKRAIWQTVQIVREIVKVMKGAPDIIFVEMARGGDKVKKRTESRKDKLIKLYDQKISIGGCRTRLSMQL